MTETLKRVTFAIERASHEIVLTVNRDLENELFRDIMMFGKIDLQPVENLIDIQLRKQYTDGH